MTVTYPLAFPSIGVVSSTFRLVRSVSVSSSPFTFAQKVYKHSGERWEGEVTLRTMRQGDAAEVQAFLAQLRGRFGTFLYGDPDYLALGPRGALGGTPLVDGGSQTGNTLNIKGFTALVTNVVRKGDYIQLGTGTSASLYMITSDQNSDSSGNVTVDIEPALRVSSSDNDAVTITGAKGLFRLSENTAEWQANKSNLYNMTIPFVEAISA